MTTTLRPVGPGAGNTGDDPNGQLYAIHAHGQRVGSLSLVERAGSNGDAWIDHLTVDPEHQRQGHGAAAVLAAEEILRNRGCRRSGLRAAPDDQASAGAATALGYTERSRNMAKSLGHAQEPSEPPPGVTLRPLTEAELPAWLAAEREMSLTVWTGRGATRAEAEDQADEALRNLLPDGLRTAGTVVRVAVRNGADAGTLWVHTGSGTSGGTDSWVYSVRVAPDHRRFGIGRALMAEAERVSRAAGAATLGLHVLSDNDAAVTLYRGLGYRTTRVNWSKDLS